MEQPTGPATIRHPNTDEAAKQESARMLRLFLNSFKGDEVTIHGKSYRLMGATRMVATLRSHHLPRGRSREYHITPVIDGGGVAGVPGIVRFSIIPVSGNGVAPIFFGVTPEGKMIGIE